MEKNFKEMTYKEFCDFCNKRACDGQWGMNDALSCIKIVEHINNIKIKKFGIYHKMRTEQVREKEWRKFEWK
ncbi:MAG: hypothetical protein ACRCX2_19470 [Paraclostridium sp.]